MEKYRRPGPGSHGPQVARLHAALLATGADVAGDELVESVFAASTRAELVQFQRDNDLPITGTVDDWTEPALMEHLGSARYVVGRVVGSDGRPVTRGVRVRAYDRDIRGEEVLGETGVEADGTYLVKYDLRAAAEGEVRTADVFVRAFADEQQLTDPPMAETVFNAPELVSISIVLSVRTPPRETEYDRVNRRVKPALGELPWEGVRENAEHPDVTFLAGETGESAELIGYVAAGHHVAGEFGGRVEFYYAVFRSDLLVTARAWATTTPLFRIDAETPQRDILYSIALLDREVVLDAVRRAVDEFVVPRSALDEASMDEVLQRHAEAAREYAGRERKEVLFRHLQRFVVSGARDRLLEILDEDPLGDLDGLFGRLHKAGTLIAEADEELVTLSLADVFGEEPGIVDRLRDTHGIRDQTQLHRLAELDERDWAEAIGERRRETEQRPAKGQRYRDDDEAVTRRQAEALARTMAERFPTTAFAARLRRDGDTPLPHAESVAQVLADHPDFDLTRGNATRLFRERAERGESDDAEVLSSFRTVQRVFTISPRYEQVRALLADGIDSAMTVSAMGRKRFVTAATKSGEFTVKQAEASYSRAKDQHSATLLFAGQLASASGAMGIAALGGGSTVPAEVEDDFPTMKSLFQQGDMCACEDCRSVHGAPAYLVDVLQFLKHRLVVDTTAPAVPVKVAKDVLFARRPDLGDTDLSCANTNTPLPYLDVVCELLEEAVAPDPGFAYNGPVAPGVADPALVAALQGAGWPFTDKAAVYGPDLPGAYVVRDELAVARLVPAGGGWTVRRLRQTYGTAAEVAAAPEYVNAQAYVTLAAANSAFGLPFDLAHAETQAYFGQLDLGRADLMALLQKAGVPADRDIAADRLGLTDAQRALVVTPAPGSQDDVWDTPGAVAALANVDTFVTRSGIAYADLLALLELPWVDGGADLFVRHLDSGCDLAKKEIANLGKDALDRIHRFERLRRALGWKAATLDRALRHVDAGAGTLDDACLVRLAVLLSLARRLRLSIEDLLDVLGPVTTADAVYARVFLNASAVGTVDPAFLPDAVAASEAAEAATPGTGVRLKDHAAYLALALGASDADVALLLDIAGDPALGAARIGWTYGALRLARAVRLPLAAVRTLADLVGVDPLGTLDELATFVAAAEAVRASGTAVPRLGYLLTHEAADLAAVEIPAARVTAFVTDLDNALDAAREATASPYDDDATPLENAAAVRAQLGALPGVPADLQAAMQTVLTDEWTDPAVPEDAVVDVVLGPLVDTIPIKNALVVRAAAAPAAKDAARNAVIEAVADAVAGYLYGIARDEALAGAAAVLLAVPEERAVTLLDHAHLKEPAAAGSPRARDVLLDDTGTPAATALKERTARLLHTVVLAAAPYEMTEDLLGWVLDNAAALGWLEWDRLPYETGLPTASYDAWASLQAFFSLVAAYPDVANTADPEAPFTVTGVYDLVLAGAAPAGLLGYAAVLTGHDAVAFVELDAHLGFSVPDLTAYHDPATLVRVVAAATMLRQLGLDVPTAVAVTAPTLAQTDAQAMRAALKTRYSDTEWLGVLKQVQDGLRERKRDALVAYLCATDPAVGDANDLYDRFLIDVEMASCMATSRIVQAHATVQLFVQRCLMGLEPDSVASIGADDGWKQWEWMANFRVWEANRKIFLWPENWIEPDLRDDKSELFVALDDTLQQDALTELAVEDATSAYLEGLSDIAHLDVMATYYEAPAKTMHVFARTKGGDPAVYYHRELQQERYWTPWATVPLDITGDHLLAFDRNDRLTLAWAVFTEEPDTSEPPPDTPDPASLGGGQANENAAKRWKIQLAVSERANGTWRPKKVSAGFLATGYQQDLPATTEFNFFAWGLGKSQAITCVGENGIVGSFALTGCKGVPEPTNASGFGGFLYPRFVDTALRAGRFREQGKDATDDLTIVQLMEAMKSEILGTTPGRFTVTYPMQMSLLDWILLAFQTWAVSHGGATIHGDERRRLGLPLGTLMPWFFGDYDRSYVVVPGFYPRRERPGILDSGNGAAPVDRKTFSNVLQLVEDVVALIAKYLKKFAENPSQPLADLFHALVADPEYLRLREEVRSYKGLRYGLDFRNFYHPLACAFRSALHQSGIPGLLDRELQLTDTGFSFDGTYRPTSQVVTPYPREDVDFTLEGAYSAYNWELFFHLPFDIGKRLSRDQQFAEAREWYHYVFNPVGAGDGPAPNRYWVTKPFFLMTPQDYLDQRIDAVLGAVAADPSGATISDLAFAVSQWREKPFKPHVVARSRPVAYQVAMVLAYVQNLCDWGDSLFRQFTRESVTQATQLYVLADKMLGPVPRVVPPAVPPPPMTYNQLEPDVDLVGNALLDLEALIPDVGLLPHGGAELPPPPATLTSLYFCIPPNSKMLEIWELVADRLLKIRHCRNIDGVEASLALFSPPIDPGALVRAVAGGMSISSFVAGLGAPLPHYRFSVLSRKAADLAQQVGAFGAELLTVLEKRDAEALARLRQDHEISMLAAMRDVKVAAMAEAEGALTLLTKSREVIQARHDFYSSQDYMNPWEITAVALNGVSLLGESAVALGYVLSGALKLVPNFLAGGAGFGGSPTVTVTTGGQSFGGSAEDAATAISAIARVADKGAGMALTQGGYQRRQEEWDFQAGLAERELAAHDVQIANAELHLETLKLDLAQHDLQAGNAAAERDAMHRKYTNQELYEWMRGQIQSVYYKAYQLAFDTAKKAERCYGYELATDRTFIRYGYWDSAKKGLMAHHGLSADIARMEAAYLDDDKREYELTKHVSLAQLDPGALVRLKALGSTTISVPETAFDMDHPSHYMRRIKSVSISLVCSAGPYTTVAATLSLVGNKYRKKTTERAGAASDKEKYAEVPGSDERFAYNAGSIASIATSTASSDGGLFELSFNDERYLPFEGAGAISTWQLQLPTVLEQIDRSTISDVVLHVRYTAREGGSTFRAMSEAALVEMSNEMVLTAARTGWWAGLSLREQFPDEWWQLQSTGTTQLTIGPEHLPFAVRAHGPAITAVTWVATVENSPASYPVTLDGTPLTLNRDATMKTLCVGTGGAVALGTPVTVAANAAKLRDLTLLVHYAVTP